VPGVRDFRDLTIWQRAMEIAEGIYDLSNGFPPDERFGLTNQLRRSAVSLPSNIAEGHGRETPAEFARFLRICRGSLAELQTQLILAERLGYCSSSQALPVQESLEEFARMLRGMQRSVDASPEGRRSYQSSSVNSR